MSAEPRIEYRLGATHAPVLRAFMACRERCSFIQGPVGSGKTFGVLQRMLAQMAEQPANRAGIRPTRWVAVRNSYPELAATTIKDFLAVFAPHGQDPLGQMSWHSIEPPTFRASFRLPDSTRVESEVMFLALDREDAIRKVRGLQITGAWLNEAKELVKPVVDLLDMRHGRFPTTADGGVACGWHGLIGDTNAPDEDHWYYRLAEEVRPEGWRFFRQPGGVVRIGERWVPNTAAENLENLPARYYERGCVGKSDAWVSVFLANEYGVALDGRPVHPEYVDSQHCARDVIPVDRHLPLLLGVDFGRTPAAVVTQWLPGVGRWVAVAEFVTENMSAAIFAPELKLWLDREFPRMRVQGWGDPAGDRSGDVIETTPIEIVRAAGIPIDPAPSNVPALRRAALANPIRRNCMDGKPAFLLSPRCKVTRKGLAGGYCFRRLRIAGEERFTEQPDKNMYSHPVEALEYALLGGGEGHAARDVYERGDRQLFAEM